MFPSKIVMVSPSLMTFQPPPATAPWRLDSTLLVTSASDSFLLCCPNGQGILVRNMRLLPSSSSPELSLPVAAPLGNHSVEALDPDTARFFPFAFYLKANEIWRLAIATGQTSLFLSVSEGQVLVRNFSLAFRPHKVTESYQFLIMKDVKGKRIATFLSCAQGQVSQTLFTCHDAVLLGPEEEGSSLLLLLAEGQDSVTALDLKTGAEKAAFVLEGKLLKAVWTPLAGGYAVLYETQHDHSLTLSKSALTHTPSDIALDPTLKFKLRFDERVSALSWHRTYLKLCVGTSLRVCVLDHNLVPLSELRHAEAANITSLVWFGNTVLYTSSVGLYYCYGRGKVKLSSIPTDSIILHLTNDRIALLRSRDGEPEVLTRPLMLLEPLLLNYLSLPAHSSDLVHRLVEKMDTNLVSETLIAALNQAKLYSAAVHLIETHGLPHVSVRCKAEAMLGARRMESLWKLLQINENDRESLSRGSAELKVLADLAPRLEQLGQVSKVATVLHRQQRDWELALLSRETLKASVSPLPNPYLHQLAMPNTPLTLHPRSLTDFSLIASVFPDRQLTARPNPIHKTKLGFREAAFLLKTTDNIELFPISADRFSQWVGYDSVHEPGIVPLEAEKDREEPAGFAADEPTEEGKLLVYFRFDEGGGDSTADIVSGKTWAIDSALWMEQLEDGIPLDYEDKWGKAVPPTFAVDCSAQVTFTGLGVPRIFTIEVWTYMRPEAAGSLLSLDSISFPLQSGAFTADTKLRVAADCEVDPALPQQLWTHITLLGDSAAWKLLLNGKVAYEREPPRISGFDSLKLGPFPGKATELRIWSGQRTLADLRENWKCPLDIVNEKKKKAWSGMTIKKAGALPAPGATGLKLAPPGGKKLGLLAPPGKPLAAPIAAPAAKPLSQPTVTSPPPEPALPLELEVDMKDAMDALESGEYAEALLAMNRKLREIVERIAGAEDEEIAQLQPTLQLAVTYKLALSLLLRLQSEQQQASLESQQRAAELCNLLIQLKIRPKHRKTFGHLALELNTLAGNYSIALKIADQLMSNPSTLSEAQVSAITAQRRQCQANESRDNGLIPCACPTCKVTLPAGTITKKCASCRAQLRFCYQTFAVVTQETATQCLVCGAVYAKTTRNVGEKCGFCGLAKVSNGEFDGS